MRFRPTKRNRHTLILIGNIGIPGPLAPTFAFVDATTADPTPNCVVGIPNGNGDHRDATADDIVQVYIDDVLWFEHTLTGADIIALGFTATGVPSLSDGTRVGKAKLLRTGAQPSNFSATDSIVIDTTAPTLSSPTGTKTGSTTADLAVTTNEANGTLYTVVTTAVTGPSAAQVKAGQNHSGAAAAFAGNQAVASTGSKTFSATGLTAATQYWSHYMHEDALGNQSTVATSASFTTDVSAATATWNPADKNADVVLSNGNLTAAYGGASTHIGVRATANTGSAKKYWEYTINSTAGGPSPGFANSGYTMATNALGQLDTGLRYASNGQVVAASTVLSTIQTYTDGNVVAVAIDATAELVWFKNITTASNWNNSGTADPATGTGGISFASLGAGPWFPATSFFVGGQITINAGGSAYAGTPPSGFGNL